MPVRAGVEDSAVEGADVEDAAVEGTAVVVLTEALIAVAAGRGVLVVVLVMEVVVVEDIGSRLAIGSAVASCPNPTRTRTNKI